jgi:hypothetical protein
MERELHLIQDALEAYCVFKLTELSETDNLSISNDSVEKHTQYKQYCDERDIDPSVDKSGKVYYNMYNKHLPVFWNRIKEAFPNCTFDFIDVEKDFRNEKKKGDFVMVIRGYNNKDISFSLKAYKGSISSIQVCSGTFNSFITNFMFESDGVGMFIDSNGERFRGSNKKNRDEEMERLGYGNMLPAIHKMDKILSEQVKPYFTYSKKAEWYQNIETDWNEGHQKYGHMAIDLLLPELRKNFSDEEVKNRIIKMIGFDGEEELLLLAPNKMVDSITNERLKVLIDKVRSDDTIIRYYKHGKSIQFDFVNGGGEVILSVGVPFCLQKNGGWFLPKDKKGRFYPKEDMFLEYGQRRPKKSKEINTSTNTYVYLGRTGILS